jgi:hypothetical protein
LSLLRLDGELLVEAALGGDRGVIVVGVDEAAIADDVVGDDQTAGARVLERPSKVVGSVNLVGVDEGEVEGTDPIRLELGELVQRRSNPHFNCLAKARRGDARCRHFGVLGIGLEGNQTAARR